MEQASSESGTVVSFLLEVLKLRLDALSDRWSFLLWQDLDSGWIKINAFFFSNQVDLNHDLNVNSGFFEI